MDGGLPHISPNTEIKLNHFQCLHKKVIIIDVIIAHSSAPECWHTAPNELKPSHQDLLLGYRPVGR